MTNAALPKHIFMSYSRKDEAVMRRVVAFLREQGINVWVDNEKLVPGTPIWEEEIEKAIIYTGAVVVLLSPDSKKSPWVRREISYAEDNDKRIYPILIAGNERTAIPIRLTNHQRSDIRQNEELGLTSLCTALSFYLENLAAREQREQEAAEKAAKEKAEREAVEKAAQEKAEQDRKERERLEREAAEKAAKEKAEQEKRERRVARKESWSNFLIKVADTLKLAFPKLILFLRGVGIVIVIALLFFIISQVTPKITSIPPTTTASITPISTKTHIANLSTNTSIAKTATPILTPTRTRAPVKIWEDRFDENNLSDYVVTGSVAWDPNEKLLRLGNGSPIHNSKIYVYIKNTQNLIVQGKVLLPPRSYYYYESVAIGLKDSTYEYWATLLFGNTGDTKNRISILENDKWISDNYEIDFLTGWYWIKVFVDYKNNFLKMKTWQEGTTEPDWQLSQRIHSTWQAEQIGFRHFGAGVNTDNLIIEAIE